MMDRTYRLFHRFGSLRVTLACLITAMLVALFGGDEGYWPVGLAIALPFGLLCLNLAAAVATRRALWASSGLLGFHLALAAIALLVAADRLSGLSGHVEVTEGLAFDPALVEAESGPLHPWHLDRVAFIQGGFEIAYQPGMKRRDTVSTVHLPGVGRAGGAERAVTIGDDTPLVIAGYSFYTTFNKGFAPVVTFVEAAGTAHSGAIHLPSYPLNYFKQGNDWRLPGNGTLAKVWLHLPEAVYREDAAWRFDTPKDATLVLTVAGQRHELRPGDSVAVPGGRFQYEELRTWMGYKISSNPLVPWILAAIAMAVLSLTWHVAAKIRATPWLRAQDAPPTTAAARADIGADRGHAYVR